jgi:hypothetical protein
MFYPHVAPCWRDRLGHPLISPKCFWQGRADAVSLLALAPTPPIRNTPKTDILDLRPKAPSPSGANILAMSPSSSSHSEQPSRRFLLLPEQTGQGEGQRPSIRRYRLASIARSGRPEGADIAAARLAGELQRLRRS